MARGFSGLFLNMFSLLGIIILLILIVGFIGVLKDMIKALFIKGKMSRIYHKLQIIDNYSKEIIKDFRKGANFIGLAKTGELGEELKELDKLMEEFEEEKKA